MGAFASRELWNPYSFCYCSYCSELGTFDLDSPPPVCKGRAASDRNMLKLKFLQDGVCVMFLSYALTAVAATIGCPSLVHSSCQSCLKSP